MKKILFGCFLFVFLSSPLAAFEYSISHVPQETDPIVGAITGIPISDGAGTISAATAGTDYQGVLTEGAFANGDKTKLDNIETNADVTDAANVNAVESDPVVGAITGIVEANGAGVISAAADIVSKDLTPSLSGNLDIGTHKLVGNGGTTGLTVASNGDATFAGNVGVGATPTAALDVRIPTIGVAAVIGSANSANSIIRIESGASMLTLTSINAALSAYRDVGIYPGVAGTGLTLKTSGNAGIGTSTPDARFHVELDSVATNIPVEVTRTTLTSTGAPAIGLAARDVWELETAAGNNEVGGFMDVRITDATPASEDFALGWGLMAGGAAAVEVATLEFDGFSAPIKNIIKSATGTLATAEMRGTIVNNYNQSDDATITLDPAGPGLAFTVVLGTTVAKFFRLDPDANDLVTLDGVAGANGEYVGIASAVAGNSIQFVSVQTGAAEWNWFAYTVSGAWAGE